MAMCPMSRLDWACRELVGIGPRMDSCEKTSLSAEATFFCYKTLRHGAMHGYAMAVACP